MATRDRRNTPGKQRRRVTVRARRKKPLQSQQPFREGFRRRRPVKPFVVAFETGDRFHRPTWLSADRATDLIDEYDAVIIEYHEGIHPSQQHYLLYGTARSIDLTGEPIDSVQRRGRAKEVTGRFNWVDHGRNRLMGRVLGLHCRDPDAYKRLP